MRGDGEGGACGGGRKRGLTSCVIRVRRGIVQRVLRREPQAVIHVRDILADPPQIGGAIKAREEFEQDPHAVLRQLKPGGLVGRCTFRECVCPTEDGEAVGGRLPRRGDGRFWRQIAVDVWRLGFVEKGAEEDERGWGSEADGDAPCYARVVFTPVEDVDHLSVGIRMELTAPGDG